MVGKNDATNEEAMSRERLRAITPFRVFAEEKMSEDPAAWIKESREGHGFLRVVAEAVVEIGDGDRR